MVDRVVGFWERAFGRGGPQIKKIVYLLAFACGGFWLTMGLWRLPAYCWVVSFFLWLGFATGGYAFGKWMSAKFPLGGPDAR